MRPVTHALRRCMRKQGQAEYFLEKLHGMAEKQVAVFLEAGVLLDSWAKFREGLIGLTDVTRSHFDKLVVVRGPSPRGYNHPLPLFPILQSRLVTAARRLGAPPVQGAGDLCRVRVEPACLWGQDWSAA